MTPGALTDGLETLLAYVRFGSESEAAAYLDVPVTTVRSRLMRLRARYAAKHTTHLVAKLYPALHEMYVVQHDEPH